MSAAAFRLPAFGRRRAHRACARLALLLAVALILAQTLGFLHRTIHVDSLRGSAAMTSVQRSAAASGLEARALRSDASNVERRAPHRWIKALFASHTGEHDCDAFDQLGHADFAVGAEAGSAVAAQAGNVAALHGGWHIAAQACGFLARGPPLLA